ncbi:replication restart helicase PriA [Cyclobacterium marinum]|uniref:Replication restart protein PriA n=1 Tax=Cyclobacterium marinum (strain ATCC 25205 / DSM 745 / LMG 13164 / NCIMB 1802) TaxID=880070 RepID=G0IXU0_CYCMS|nr:primosomal protein N' [Cyclobacterium marinum]AEL28087.1 primosomal protein N' [Cyclobacterium marinum DSM 745]
MEDLFGHSYPSTNKTLFADIILPVPIPRSFTYSVDPEIQDEIGIGYRVMVQFGKKRILTGIVAKVHQKAPEAYKAKPILDLLDDFPIVNALQIKFWGWMAGYYCCHIGEVMNAALPSGLKLSTESKVQIHPDFDLENPSFPMDERELVILEALEKNPEMNVDQLEPLVAAKDLHKIIKSLLAKKAILVYESVKEKYSPKIETRVRFSPEYLSESHKLNELFEKIKGKVKQENVLLKYLQQVPVFNDQALNEQGLAKKVLTDAGCSSSSIDTLVKNKVFETFKIKISRFDPIKVEEKSIELSQDQLEAYESIQHEFGTKSTVLLHGITGSGKTEIYIKLINEVLDSGSQVLLLLPEIALTTHLVSRLQKVFGDTMGIFHSRYSDNERVDVWQGVLSGKYNFIIGVRSSLFLPFDSLGLVIVDEEHESSYKQFDPAPRFHARDAALMLAWLHQAKTVLGTATPAFESFYNAQTGKYGYVKMDKRYGGAELPHFHLADILKDKKKNLLKLDFTRLMREKIQEALNNQEQVLIFQNRRGYAPYISCEECGWIPECEHCDVSLTYHQYQNELRCHYCGFKEKVPNKCQACGSEKITTVGSGTERIEENLSLLFPEARILRMDLDTTRSKYGYQKILEEFGSGNVDILVGTQMITKGLDFDRVSLVGIVDADRILFYPDFRSGERAFQQITQVAGRAGRRNKTGNVIVQTRRPDQLIFNHIIEGKYTEFYQQEMGERRQFYYPPFVKNIKIVVKHKDFKITETAAFQLKNLLVEIEGRKIILGPEKALIGKIKNLFHFEIWIKLERSTQAQEHFKHEMAQKISELHGDKRFRSVRFLVDVDPS